MLNFILGRSGTGKSHYIMDTIKQICSNSDKRIFLIVPDQYTFETEQKYLKYVGANNLRNVSIMGFSRIAHHIFKTYGGVCSNYANDSVKLILMSTALREVAPELLVYKKAASNTHFASNMLSLITNFKHANIAAEDFLTLTSKFDDGLLKEKSRDIALIYSAYDAMLSQNFKDELDDVLRACEQIKHHNFFSDSLIFIDEFKDFTARELGLVRLMLIQSDEFYLSLCMPKDEKRHSLIFDCVQKSYNEITKLAREVGVKIASPISLEDNHRFKNASLSHLEENIFTACAEKTVESDNAISLVACENEYSEIEYVMSQIGKLLREDKYKYSDIVIVTRELSVYSDILENISKKYEIPIYLDKLKSIEDSPIIKFVSQILNSCSSSFTTENIISLLKFDLCGFDYSDVSQLENYCFTWDIKAFEWAKDFDYSSFYSMPIKGEEMELQNKATLQKLNQIRSKIYPALVDFSALSKDSDVKTISSALIKLLSNLKLNENISAKLKIIENADLDPAEVLSLCSEYKAVWGILGSIINIINSTIPDKKMSLKQYSELFLLVSKNFDMGTIPKSLDNVIVGDIKRIRTDSPKVLFIVGSNENIFPLVPSNAGLYTNSELTILSSMGIKLSASIHDMIKEETFIAYKTLTLPSEKLFLTARKSDIKGSSIAISSIFEQIISMFEHKTITELHELEADFFCTSKAAAFSQLTSAFNENSKFSATLHEYFSDKKDYEEKLNKLKQLHENAPFKLCDTATTKKLYGNNIYMSPTRAEQYHKCKFLYFCEYGLRLKKRERIRLNSLNKGLIIHDVLAKIFLEIDDYSTFDAILIRKKIKAHVDEFITETLGGFDNKSQRFIYLYTKIKKNIFEIVKRLFDELSQSEFRPSDFEYKISPENKNTYQLKTDDISINIIGSVDRIDMYTAKNSERYIRVIDYKSGTKNFDLTKVINGLNLQMFIYLMCLEKDKNKYEHANSAGVLYMPASEIANKLARDDNNSDEHVSRHYKMSGALLARDEILIAMEKQLAGKYLPINVLKNMTTNGELDEEALAQTDDLEQKYGKTGVKALLTSEQIGKLFDGIKFLLMKMANEIYSGNIEAKPLIGGGENPCDYCSYKQICGREEDGDANEYLDLSKEEIFKYIDTQIGGQNDG